MEHIDSIEKLWQLKRQAWSFRRLSKMPDYSFNLPGLSEKVNHDLGEMMNIHKNECGCTTGGLFMGTSVICIAGYYIFGTPRFRDVDVRQLSMIASIILACAVLGKLLGLIRARIKMIQLINKIPLLTGGQSLILSLKGE